MHAGEKLGVAKGEAMTAWSVVSGQPVVTPNDAVLGMLQMSWLRAHLYAGLLERQFTEAQDEVEPEQVDDGAEGYDFGGCGGDPPLGPGRGLVGHTRGALKDIGIYVSGEAARALTVLEGQERDKLVRYAKVAHDMGIAGQQVKLAEQQGVMLAQVIRRTADALLVVVLGLVAELARDSAGGDQLVRFQDEHDEREHEQAEALAAVQAADQAAAALLIKHRVLTPGPGRRRPDPQVRPTAGRRPDPNRPGHQDAGLLRAVPAAIHLRGVPVLPWPRCPRRGCGARIVVDAREVEQPGKPEVVVGRRTIPAIAPEQLLIPTRWACTAADCCAGGHA
jgi:hypothetical protein